MQINDCSIRISQSFAWCLESKAAGCKTNNWLHPECKSSFKFLVRTCINKQLACKSFLFIATGTSVSSWCVQIGFVHKRACGDATVICVSQGCMSPAQISVGMHVSSHI